MEDPREYAEVFGLTEAELSSLSDMAADLAALMPSFVTKRERVLRRAMHLTLDLLDDDELADLLLQEFSDTHPAIEKMTPEMLAFAAFLIAEIEARADSLPHGAALVDMARLECLRLRSFGTPTPLWPPIERDPLSSRGFDPLRRLQVHPTAAWDRFAYDLRSVRRPEDLGRVRPDPCDLIYFQWDKHGGLRVIRVAAELARALDLIAQQPDGMIAADVVREIGSTYEAALGKLVRQGVLRSAA
jgi:hypothetical protein